MFMCRICEFLVAYKTRPDGCLPSHRKASFRSCSERNSLPRRHSNPRSPIFYCECFQIGRSHREVVLTRLVIRLYIFQRPINGSVALFTRILHSKIMPNNLLCLREGDIMKAKPKHFIPRPDGSVCTVSIILHVLDVLNLFRVMLVNIR